MDIPGFTGFLDYTGSLGSTGWGNSLGNSIHSISWLYHPIMTLPMLCWSFTLFLSVSQSLVWD